MGLLSSAYDDVHDRLGVYALVGASAMLAGMARITISLTVILIECTNDVQYALPIMLCVMFAKWVADLFNHGLYDIHIHLKQVPLLEPFSEKEMYAIRASHVMSRRVESLPQVATLKSIIEALTETQHSTYPVVTSDRTMLYLGMLRRDFLCGLLLKAGPQLLQKTHDEPRPPLVSWDIIQDMFPSYPSIKEATAWATEDQLAQYINLLPYANTNAYTVRSNACMRRVYTLFRGMGLRCLPVLNEKSNQVTGLITRQDLSHHAVHEALAIAASEPEWMGNNETARTSGIGSLHHDMY
jgi:chloride channel 7